MALRNGKLVEIANGFFEKNEAQSLGGALYLLNVQTIALIGLNFQNNEAAVDGGAVAVYGTIQSDLSEEEIILTTLRLTDSYFVSNKVQRRGGAFYGNNLFQVLIQNSTFERNTALFGGAVSTDKSTGNISNSYFLDNSALAGGGGVYWLYEVNGPIVRPSPSPSLSDVLLTLLSSMWSPHASPLATAPSMDPSKPRMSTNSQPLE
jgi:hypothetical protein